MPSIFWTGKLSPTMKIVVNFSNCIAWVTGNAKDTSAMKQRLKSGYDGVCSDDVTRYDQLGLDHYTKIAETLLEGRDFSREDTVLDVGCGTGIMSFVVVKKEPAKVICGDQSDYMLNQCKKKAMDLGLDSNRVDFKQLDAENLPFPDESMDVAVSGMVLGFVPNPAIMVAEMTRVLKSGGWMAVSTHGPDLYHEAIEAYFRAVPKNLVLGYRIEFWPRTKEELESFFSQAGLKDIQVRQVSWKHTFNNGGQAYDFFLSTSSAWWYSRFPSTKIEAVSKKVKSVFERKQIKEITMDVILAYGCKP